MYDDMFKKVLIIEDELSYRDIIRDYLSAHGCTVSTADNGEMAMEKLLVHRPNLVILDLLLPKVDGFEVLKRIRTYPDEEIKNMPVIVLSNLSSSEAVLKAQALKIDAYFVKANTPQQLVLNKVQEILFKGAKPGEEVWDFTKE